ncbi:MAG: GTP-binding protein EngB [Methanosarcinales archaeon]|nr:GTP-binding protein EngB [Methanosarcinales archaeon]
MSKQIVLVGRSNVGKSTLFKQLTGKWVKVGRRPGVTVSPGRAQKGNILYVDMPGYGYMHRVPKKVQEGTKDFIVRYMEENRDEILLAIQVIDAASFLEIADRWEGKGEVPVEIEMWEFLKDLELNPVLAANKMDRVINQDQVLDWIVERLGMEPPWTGWTGVIAPISAKTGQIEPLRKIIQSRL